MKVQTKIQKWGNGLAIRIAGIIRDVPHFEEGMPIIVDVFEDRLEVRKLAPKKQHLLPWSEAELLVGMTPQTVHAEIIANLLPSEYK
jgi:antitoxin MazE